MSRRPARVGVCLCAALSLSACGLGGGSDDRVELEFFQFKGEAIQAFNDVIADFEAENPGIRVVQNAVADAETSIRTRLVRNDVPDVMTLNGNFSFGELSEAGVFYDFAGEPVLDDVNPAIVEILQGLGAGGEGEVNGVPFANNASGVIYNKDLFAEHGVEVPTTFDELVAAAETFRAAGVLPVYGTLKDQWTSLPAWNAITANVMAPDFFDRLRAEETSFAEVYPEVAERLGTVFSFAQDDRLSRDYNTGNQQFAQGASAMYMQGSFAIPAIRSFDPQFEIGTFAMPAAEEPDTVLVSGVDVALTMPREPEHPAESMAFIEYLMRPEVVASYADAQSAIPTLEGLESEDPALEGLLAYFEQGRVVGYTDHQIPPSVPLQAINQTFLIDGDEAAYVDALDSDWDKVARRQL